MERVSATVVGDRIIIRRPINWNALFEAIRTIQGVNDAFRVINRPTNRFPEGGHPHGYVTETGISIARGRNYKISGEETLRQGIPKSRFIDLSKK